MNRFMQNVFNFSVAVGLSAQCMASGVLWMTDGSPVEFSDTVKLKDVLTPPSILESQPYEGAIDYLPAIGDTELLANRHSYVSTEAEWVLIKPDGFLVWLMKRLK